MKNKKTAAVFDPYLDTIGGGEVYTSTVVECLIKDGFAVDIFWNDEEVVERIRKFLGIDISQAKTNVLGYWLFTNRGRLLPKRNLTRKYDLVFFLSDGSIPSLFSRNNILHFQIPFTNVQGPSLSNRIKLRNIHHIICNSRFTKKVIDKEYKVRSKVLYPPINIKIRKAKKQNIILSVGRFTQTLHQKRQDVLVSTFKLLVDQGLAGWKLVLIGSSKEGKQMIKDLEVQSKGYPIEVMSDVEHETLEKEYARASIFWHAAGYEIDERKNPELVEHFGIATAEAMAAGCVPIVINKGGQPEIVKNGENGYLWQSIDSLKKITLQLIKSPEDMKKLASEAQKANNRFSKERFCRAFSELVSL